MNIRYDGSANYLIIDGESHSNSLVVSKATGQVGIGTIKPTKPLQVEGDISSSGDIYLENNHKLIWTGSNDIGFIELFERDVIRHDLVKKIINAYEKNNNS